jgi:DNA-binding cell septation regulator SpoVG
VKINIEWYQGDRPSFNVLLASREGAEPFINIKGCRIVDGNKGKFVSWPATKNQTTGKYWNHVYASEAFNVAVLEAAEASMPKQDTRTHAERKRAPIDDLDPPF